MDVLNEARFDWLWGVRPPVVNGGIPSAKGPSFTTLQRLFEVVGPQPSSAAFMRAACDNQSVLEEAMGPWPSKDGSKPYAQRVRAVLNKLLAQFAVGARPGGNGYLLEQLR